MRNSTNPVRLSTFYFTVVIVQVLSSTAIVFPVRDNRLAGNSTQIKINLCNLHIISDSSREAGKVPSSRIFHMSIIQNTLIRYSPSSQDNFQSPVSCHGM
jgi:hypothetical protein